MGSGPELVAVKTGQREELDIELAVLGHDRSMPWG
jgi:hypothetical protein